MKTFFRPEDTFRTLHTCVDRAREIHSELARGNLPSHLCDGLDLRLLDEVGNHISATVPRLPKEALTSCLDEASDRLARSESTGQVVESVRRIVIKALNEPVIARFNSICDSAKLKAHILKPLPVTFVSKAPLSNDEVLKGLSIYRTPFSQQVFIHDGTVGFAAGEPRLWTHLSRNHEEIFRQIYFKELASAIPPLLLMGALDGPGRYLDLCAAPGGKSFQLATASAPGSHVTALDIHPGRIERVQDMVSRFELQNLDIVLGDGGQYSHEHAEQFDAVLCDVPCSGSGRVREDSYALFRHDESWLPWYQAQAVGLLKSSISAVREGGVVCYSTCSLHPEENEAVIHAVLRDQTNLQVLDPRGLLSNSNHKEWSLESPIHASEVVQRSLGYESPFPALRFWPYEWRGRTSGFFAVVMRKT